jgi:hypothetical protein
MSENESVEKPALKLFVVGGMSGDPDDWEAWTDRHLVIAANESEALSMVECASRATAVHLVDMSKPRRLMSDVAYS